MFHKFVILRLLVCKSNDTAGCYACVRENEKKEKKKKTGIQPVNDRCHGYATTTIGRMSADRFCYIFRFVTISFFRSRSDDKVTKKVRERPWGRMRNSRRSRERQRRRSWSFHDFLKRNLPRFSMKRKPEGSKVSAYVEAKGGARDVKKRKRKQRCSTVCVHV